ncbi:tyrosine-type recombinase/integrase [Psychromonas sp. Urea-02u-13]|uniref:tyrosine-type recombinase/integrase n=1 Tax=Psychromonas sp. Urea-02u-13 TaxID=2058326 RepID=UPI000C338FFA|nr:site-specific integrase [Psychromonas sp. Urea-02u-13]PKG37638.1 integrase [Psychromonas sp. Urea-02u-13]
MTTVTFKTHNQVIGLKVTGKRYESYRASSERGKGRLGVEVSSTGTKRWIYRYYINGKRQFIRMGLVSDNFVMTIAQSKCDEFAEIVARGGDPKKVLQELEQEKEEARQAEAMKGSIKQLFRAYTDRMKTDGKRTYEAVLKSLEKEVYPFIQPQSKAKDILPTDIVPVLSSMIQRGAVVQSNRVRSYIVAAFNFGLKHDLNPAQAHTGVKFGLTTNPAQVIAKQSSAEKVGENWLALNEVKELLNTFHTVNRVGPMVSDLLALCFHTGGQRPYELVASRWESINWQEKTLLITGEVSKNKRSHLIPLTDSAIKVLKALQGEATISPFIFPRKNDSNQHLRTDSFSKAIMRYREANPETKAFVARDIRRTCKTLMGELGISKELRDRLQNHALNDVSSKHYDRYSYLSEKREALRKWEVRLTGIEAKIIEGNFGEQKHG